MEKYNVINIEIYKRNCIIKMKVFIKIWRENVRDNIRKIIANIFIFYNRVHFKNYEYFKKGRSISTVKACILSSKPSSNYTFSKWNEVRKRTVIISNICTMYTCFYDTNRTFLSKLIKLNEDERKVFRGATLIMNMTFILPFFIVFFGEKNLYLLSLFDAGNLVIVTTVVYSIFVSSKEDTAMDKIKKLLKSPLIIALIIGFVLNITGLKLPRGIEITMQEIAEMTGTLIMIALGAYFTPKFKKLKLSLIIVAIKVIGILIATFIIGKFLPIDEMGRKIMLLGAFSPVGNNILTFVFVTDGDMELAINVVSLSIILSFINVSLLLILS